MPEDRKLPGEKLSGRLAARSERPAISRATMPGGGEYFQGPLASRTLKTLGARAMTVDSSIVVGEDFDPGRAESQALFAHEQVHLESSGGQGAHFLRDAEEVAARAAESMVLHRAAAGDAPAPSADPAETAPPADADDSAETPRPGPQEGYRALAGQGLSHADIVEKLARACLDKLEEQEDTNSLRAGDSFRTW